MKITFTSFIKSIKNYLIATFIYGLIDGFLQCIIIYGFSGMFSSLSASVLAWFFLIMTLPIIIHIIYFKKFNGDETIAIKYFKKSFKITFFLALLLLFSKTQEILKELFNESSEVSFFLPVMAIISFYILKKI